MNTVITSREKLLETGRSLVKEKGLSKVSIHLAAMESGVSVGTIYNYFPSKAALITAIVESIWTDIFHDPGDRRVFEDIEAYITWIYERLRYGDGEYPEFFTLHSLGFMQGDKADGIRRMHQIWRHISGGFLRALKKDQRIRQDAFNEYLTAEHLADTLFSLMLAAMIRKDYDPVLVLEIIRRSIF